MNNKIKISLFVIASIGIIMTTSNISSFAFAKTIIPLNTTDELMHLTEAIKALRSGDIQGAKMHLTEAINSLDSPDSTTDGSMHLTEAIKALRSGDIQGAKMHLTEAINSF